MSGWFRVTVVKQSNHETVRTFEVEVPEHPHPVALGVGVSGNPVPDVVLAAASKKLKKGEAVDQIVHLAEGAPA